MNLHTSIILLAAVVCAALLALADENTNPGDEMIKEKVSEVFKNDEGLRLVHEAFAVGCFNRCWQFMDKEERTPEEIDEMLLLACSSLWHWKQRADATPTNLSVGYWQVSRAFANAELADAAAFFGQRCLDISTENELPPFYIGYAHEAVARAAALSGDDDAFSRHLELAKEKLEVVSDEESKKLLSADLEHLSK